MVVACIDYGNGGHRLHLMRMAVKSLLKLGCKVVCITNETSPIQDWIEQNAANKHNVVYYSHTLVKAKERKNGHLNDCLVAAQYWKQYNSVLKKIEHKYQLCIDVVLINYIDIFLSRYFPISIQKKLFPYKWAGLYIHPRYMRMYASNELYNKKSNLRDIDYFFTSKRCLGVGIFDNGIVPHLSSRIGKPATLMPDISDISTNNKNYPVVDDIKKAAKGRTIIGSIGMSYYSGVIDLIKLVNTSAKEKYFFVFVGQFDEGCYAYIPNEEDRILLRNFRNTTGDNFIWKEDYLENEQEYNAVFNTLDIIFMMYPEHYTSSNRLTKAAFFKKLVLASNVHCVGENVVKYKLGEVATPGNIAEQLGKLEILNQQIATKNFPIKQWETYYELNSNQVFQAQLKKLLIQ